jgi:PAS domain-containing protein
LGAFSLYLAGKIDWAEYWDVRIIWISENTYTVRDRYGNLLDYEGTVQDITTRKQAEAALRLEQEKSDRLLLNILPEPIAERLKHDPSIIAYTFAEVTVLFADIVGFTQLSARVSPKYNTQYEPKQSSVSAIRSI